MLDILRHREIFNPAKHCEHRVNVIGVGALGSWVALGLAKLGVRDIWLWDFDTVEGHNLCNQVYGVEDIGKPKVEACAEFIKRNTGAECTTNNTPVTKDTALEGYVFVLTDTMSSRKEIYEGALRFKPKVVGVFEGRMGARDGRIYTFDPADVASCKQYEQTFYTDEESEVSTCGSAITVGPTAMQLSGALTWQFIKYTTGLALQHEVCVEYMMYSSICNTWSNQSTEVVDYENAN